MAKMKTTTVLLFTIGAIFASCRPTPPAPCPTVGHVVEKYHQEEYYRSGTLTRYGRLSGYWVPEKFWISVSDSSCSCWYKIDRTQFNAIEVGGEFRPWSATNQWKTDI